MLKGKLGDGSAFSIDHFGIDCEDKKFISILQRASRKYQSIQHMESAYEAETMLGQHFIQKYGGEITSPSDAENYTHWAVLAAEAATA